MTPHDPASKALRPMVRVALAMILLACAGVFSLAQEPESPQQEQQDPAEVASTSIPAGPGTTVHGMVRDDASGEPLPRALVRISGDAATGALTDGDGRFEIPNVPVGPQDFEVVKPGFMDRAADTEGSSENSHSFAHNVIVVAGMSDIVFAMTRVNSIRGVLQLSTGEPAHAIQVTLLKRTIQDGRVVWQTAGASRTNSEGVYRFGGLADGVYALYTDPTMESEAATDLVEPGRGRSVARGGYASEFYPDARDLAGAAKIRLAAGEQAQADMSLTLEPFHLVAATVGFPSGVSDRAGSNFSFMVLDARGHQLPYSAQYDPNTRTMQTMLPDGAYSLVAIATRSRLPGFVGSGSTFTAPGGEVFTGQIDVSVAGRAVSSLRIPLAAVRTSPVQVSVMRTGVAAAQPGNSGTTVSARESGVFISVSQTGAWISDGMVMSFAQGSSAGPLESSFISPGAYWVHTNVAQKGLCESSFTAGGAGLAHEPLVLGSSGATVPLTLALRDDCASLTLALPASMSVPAAGEEPFYTIYVVPDFESTVDVVPQTLRASSGARITLAGLTPGDYRVYAFNRPVALEYRNPAALSGLRGQAVTLGPGAEHELVVEAGQQ
jgi:Carboxypeptidase regulatory-like domain